MRQILIGFVLCLAACGGHTPADKAPAETQYKLTGTVVSVDRAGKRVTVDHEAIPGFMDAMTMPYPVKDDPALETLSAGDAITATLVSSRGLYWLESVRVVGHADGQAPAPAHRD